MYRKLISSIFLFLFVASATAFGQLQIGYMNTQEVLSQAPEREQVQKKLNSFIQKKRQELQQQTAAFQDSVAEFQQNQSAMSQAEIKKAEQRLSQMRSSMQQFQQSIQQQIQRRRSELLQPIFNRMDQAIAAVAKDRGLDFVLNESTSNGEQVIYYSSSQRLDITDEVVQKMKDTSE